MPKPTCDHVPIRLRTRGRRPSNNFPNPDENLYKWYPPTIQQDGDGYLSAATIGEVFQPPCDISCNRQLFCLHPTDVLYRTVPGEPRLAFGIISCTAGLLDGYSFNCRIVIGNNPVVRTISFGLEHTPEECMYPHSEIRVLVDGEQLSDPVKPKTLKSGVREELRTLFRIVHPPTPSFTFDEIQYDRSDLTVSGVFQTLVKEPSLIKEILTSMVRGATTKRSFSERIRRSIRHSMPTTNS